MIPSIPLNPAGYSHPWILPSLNDVDVSVAPSPYNPPAPSHRQQQCRRRRARPPHPDPRASRSRHSPPLIEARALLPPHSFSCLLPSLLHPLQSAASPRPGRLSRFHQGTRAVGESPADLLANPSLTRTRFDELRWGWLGSSARRGSTGNESLRLRRNARHSVAKSISLHASQCCSVTFLLQSHEVTCASRRRTGSPARGTFAGDAGRRDKTTCSGRETCRELSCLGSVRAPSARLRACGLRACGAHPQPSQRGASKAHVDSQRAALAACVAPSSSTRPRAQQERRAARQSGRRRRTADPPVRPL